MSLIKINGNIEFCNKENTLLKTIEREGVNTIYRKLLNVHNACQCCDFIPKPTQKLKMHVVSLNDIAPMDSICVLLCDACYYIKHFELAIELDYPVLVNSEYSQIDLVKIQRNSTIAINNEIDKKRISILKQKPIDYLNTIKKDNLLFSPYIKFVFGDKFNWSNCR